MSVETFIPGQSDTSSGMNLTMTERAQRKAEAEVSRRQALGLRLTVKASGCSGFRYLLDFVTEPVADDLRMEITERLALFIAKDSVNLVKGTEIDYVTEGLNASFQFKNPNATGECGCGESFTVD
jgi:Fe-S cluster assembly protein SufA/iron-sulfur cluster assembly protein